MKLDRTEWKQLEAGLTNAAAELSDVLVLSNRLSINTSTFDYKRDVHAALIEVNRLQAYAEGVLLSLKATS